MKYFRRAIVMLMGILCVTFISFVPAYAPINYPVDWTDEFGFGGPNGNRVPPEKAATASTFTYYNNNLVGGPNVRMCLYDFRQIKQCPNTRTVGGPNPGEVAATNCLGSSGGSQSLTMPAHDVLHCAYDCATPGGPPLSTTENLKSNRNQYVTRLQQGAPTLTEWGVIILVVLLISSTAFIMLRRRKASVPA